MPTASASWASVTTSGRSKGGTSAQLIRSTHSARHEGASNGGPKRHAMVGDGFELRSWSAPAYAYGEFECLRLPVRGAAVWTLHDGSRFPYIDVELTDVAFDPTW